MPNDTVVTGELYSENKKIMVSTNTKYVYDTTDPNNPKALNVILQELQSGGGVSSEEIAQINSELNTLQSDVNALETSMSNANSNVTTLQNNYDQIQSTINGLGSAASLNTGTSAGEIPVLDNNGKIAQSTLPDTISEIVDNNVVTPDGKISADAIPEIPAEKLSCIVDDNNVIKTESLPTIPSSKLNIVESDGKIKTSALPEIDSSTGKINANWLPQIPANKLENVVLNANGNIIPEKITSVPASALPSIPSSKISGLGTAASYNVATTGNNLITAANTISLIGNKQDVINNATYHNSVCRNQEINWDATTQANISNGSFANIFVGDYMYVGRVQWYVAGINLFKTYSFTTNHIVVFPVAHFNVSSKMFNAAPSGSNPNGYGNSDLYKTAIKTTFTNAVNTAFGTGHLCNAPQRIITSLGKVTSGYIPFSMNSTDNYPIQLMTMVHLYGFKLPSYSIIDNLDNFAYLVSNEESQFPIFKFMPNLISAANNYFIRDYADCSHYYYVDKNGNLNIGTSTTSMTVRPYVVLK